MKIRFVTKKKYAKSKIYFTIIELLMVISIIAILACILLPALTKARNKAMQIKCLGNLRQMGFASGLYINDYNSLCTKDTWLSGLCLYIQTPGNRLSSLKSPRCPYACPTPPNDADTSVYGYNSYSIGYNCFLMNNETLLVGPRFLKPSKHCFLADAFSWKIMQSTVTCSYTEIALRHSLSTNVLYTDFHANSRKRETFTTGSEHSPFWSSSPAWTNMPD